MNPSLSALSLALILASVLSASGCPLRAGTASETSLVVDTVDGGPVRIETSQAEIAKFVKAGRYKDWCKEADIHISTGPHPKRVRTYWNPTLFQSLKVENTVHPRGSVAVKELYDDPDGKPIGHAVGVKTEDDASDESWVWFEGHGPDYGSPFYGVALPICRDCHRLAPFDNVWGSGHGCY